MKIGKISESVLKRSVLKEIKYKRKEVLISAGLGRDASSIRGSQNNYISSIATIKGELKISGKRAFYGAINSNRAAFSKPVGIMISILLSPDIMESDLREFMVYMNMLSETEEVSIIGGHTETDRTLNEPVITVTALGYEVEHIIDKDDVNADIILINGIGLEGLSLILKEKDKEIRERFSTHYIDCAKKISDDFSIKNITDILENQKVISMHDLSKTGVFGALWELGEKHNKGLVIDLKKIRISQEVVEFCEYFDINPYIIPSLGGLLIVTKDSKNIVNLLREKEIEADIIGKMEKGRDKILINGEEKRFLEPHKAGYEFL